MVSPIFFHFFPRFLISLITHHSQHDFLCHHQQSFRTCIDDHCQCKTFLLHDLLAYNTSLTTQYIHDSQKRHDATTTFQSVIKQSNCNLMRISSIVSVLVYLLNKYGSRRSRSVQYSKRILIGPPVSTTLSVLKINKNLTFHRRQSIIHHIPTDINKKRGG